MTDRNNRPLTDADRAAWAAYAGRLTPLPRRAMPPPAGQTVPPTQPAPAAPASAPARPERPVAIGEPAGGLDKATWRRFRSGRMASTRRLDLHGMTAQRAFHALVAFLRSAHADRMRCVEVVTGRGSSESGGVIRRELPLWLNLPELRPLVLAATYPHPANPGAVRLLLRRVR